MDSKPGSGKKRTMRIAHNVDSVQELALKASKVNFNVMRSINLRFNYLLTYFFTFNFTYFTHEEFVRFKRQKFSKRPCNFDRVTYR